MTKRRNTSSWNSEFSADRPITKASEDLLERKAFAVGFAKRIESWNPQSSLVTSLCGEWGCGKTSLKNMILEELAARDPLTVQPLEFNPWEISGHDSLTGTFFHELSLTIVPTDGATPVEIAASKRLQMYAKGLSWGASALRALGSSMMWADMPEGQLLQTVSQAADQAANVAQAGATFQAADRNEQSLAEIKSLLIKDMAKLKRPILIVIDDIDRLTMNEIREVFQVVKANANLPNLIYLLLFDREIVTLALNAISGERGHEFLEKIVQAPFHVPQPPEANVHKALFEELDRYINDPEVRKRWETDRWSMAWKKGLSTYFSNLRHVYRFLNSFGFHMSLMRNKKTFELNILDLLILETLRVFEPGVYEAISTKRDILTSAPRGLLSMSEDETKLHFEATVDGLLSTAPTERRTNIRSILTSLFPAFFMRDFRDNDLLMRQLRVGHEDLFERYFSMSLTSNDVAQSDLDSMLADLSNPRKFARICQSLKKQSRLGSAISRLGSYKGHLPISNMSQTVTSLIDGSEYFPVEDDRNLFKISSLAQAYYIIHSSLQEIKDEEIRFDHLKTGIESSTGLRLLILLLARQEHTSQRSSEDLLLTHEHWLELKLIVLARIEQSASNGKLRNLPELTFALWRWKDWAGGEAPKIWISCQLKNTSDALWILSTFLSTMRSEGSKVTFTRYINLAHFEVFCDIQHIQSLTHHLNLDKLNLKNKRALRAFRYALKWRKEGKADDYYKYNYMQKNPLEEDF